MPRIESKRAPVAPAPQPISKGRKLPHHEVEEVELESEEEEEEEEEDIMSDSGSDSRSMSSSDSQSDSDSDSDDDADLEALAATLTERIASSSTSDSGDTSSSTEPSAKRQRTALEAPKRVQPEDDSTWFSRAHQLSGARRSIVRTATGTVRMRDVSEARLEESQRLAKQVQNGAPVGEGMLEKRQRRAEAEAAPQTAGKMWFDLPATEMTAEIKRDLQLLSMRQHIDTKRFYKNDKSLKAPPKFFQMGTIVEGAQEFYSSRLAKKERRATIVDEVLADAQKRQSLKRRFLEIQQVKSAHTKHPLFRPKGGAPAGAGGKTGFTSKNKQRAARDAKVAQAQKKKKGGSK
jgi:hypothetical protein